MVKMNKKVARGDPLKILGRSKGYSRKEVLRYIVHHEEQTPNLIKEIKRIPDVVLQNVGTPIAKKAIKMVREVFREVYRAKQFTRTNINNRGVLYGIVLLKHKVMDLVLHYFHQRWPNCVICLYNEHTEFTGIMNEKGIMRRIQSSLEEVVEELSLFRPIKPYFDDIQFSGKEIFETLYMTQNISTRENPRYFKQMIPDKCYNLPGMRDGIEKRFSKKNKNLDEFL